MLLMGLGDYFWCVIVCNLDLNFGLILMTSELKHN